MILFVVIHVNSVRHRIDWLVVALFIGYSGANDIERFQVQWIHKAGYDIIAGTVSPTLDYPDWTIPNKFNPFPGSTADSDDFLEHEEQFVIIL